MNSARPLTAFSAACLILTSCSKTEVTTYSESSNGKGNYATTQPDEAWKGKSASPTDEDRAILELVFKDLLNFEDFSGISYRTPQTSQIVVHDKTIDREFMKSIDRQTLWEANDRGFHINPDAYESLVQRNSGSVSISALGIQDNGIVLADLNALSDTAGVGWEDRFQKAFPQAKGYVYARLPGLTADGKTAVVRLTVGPSDHGETATWLLKKHHGKWQVAWRMVSHYL